MISRLLIQSAALTLGLGLAAGTQAATLIESTAPGGAFSGAWDSPTEVGRGFETVSGTGSQNVYDNLVFTGLPAGGQKLTLSFSAPAGIDYSYSAGATLFYSATPFRTIWDWSAPAKQVQVGYWNPQQTVELDLGDSFSGKLYLALNFTHGRDLGYSIAAPSNAAPATPGGVAPVPIPAGRLLMVTAAAALGATRLRRRPAAA